MPTPWASELCPRPRKAAGGFLLLVALAGAFAWPATAALGGLSSELEKAIRQGRPAKSTIGVSVRDLGSGREVFRLDADKPLIPASNMKVLTTGAALVALGSDFRFRSSMRLVDRAGSPPDLMLVGDGDPAFADPELLSFVTWTRPDGSRTTGLDADAFLEAWISAIVDSGARAIGTVVVDDRIFERTSFHPEWPKDQFSEEYCAEVHGFNFHHNLLYVWPSPRAGGAATVARMSPSLGFLPISNRTTSNRAASAKHSFWIGRSPGSNQLTLNGNVQVAPKDPVAITLDGMPALLAELMARRLRSAGVEVGGSRLADAADPAGTGRILGPTVETPLATVLHRANTDSDNLAAESLLKRVVHAETGGPGSWAAATTVLPGLIARRLSDPDSARGLSVSDGSGLSRRNRITASLMTRWIASMEADPALAAPFRDSLAVAGETGTVRKRFKGLEKTGAEVHCKTGFIRGVSCLSGVVTGADGRRMAFSILGNDLTAENAIGRMKELQERIVLEIAEELATPRAALGG